MQTDEEKQRIMLKILQKEERSSRKQCSKKKKRLEALMEGMMENKQSLVTRKRKMKMRGKTEPQRSITHN